MTKSKPRSVEEVTIRFSHKLKVTFYPDVEKVLLTLPLTKRIFEMSFDNFEKAINNSFNARKVRT